MYAGEETERSQSLRPSTGEPVIIPEDGVLDVIPEEEEPRSPTPKNAWADDNDDAGPSWVVATKSSRNEKYQRDGKMSPAMGDVKKPKHEPGTKDTVDEISEHKLSRHSSVESAILPQDIMTESPRQSLESLNRQLPPADSPKGNITPGPPPGMVLEDDEELDPTTQTAAAKSVTKSRMSIRSAADIVKDEPQKPPPKSPSPVVPPPPKAPPKKKKAPPSKPSSVW